MDSLNNNLSTRQLSPELKDLLSRRTSNTEVIADANEVDSSKGQIEELTENLQNGQINNDPNIASDLSEIIASSLQNNNLGTINFNNNSDFGSGKDDGHDPSEAREIKSQLIGAS